MKCAVDQVVISRIHIIYSLIKWVDSQSTDKYFGSQKHLWELDGGLMKIMESCLIEDKVGEGVERMSYGAGQKWQWVIMSISFVKQWDIRSGEIVQEYDRHLGAVNTITFVDLNRRFVSTSDDKSLRVWEW